MRCALVTNAGIIVILISLLIALALDRVFTRPEKWRSAWVTRLMLIKLSVKRTKKYSRWKLWAAVALPALLLLLLELFVIGHFLTFIIQTAVLYLALGCTTVRDTYKSWLQAANREDNEACDLYQRQLYLGMLGKEDDAPEPDDGTMMQQLLLLANYQFYAAVIIFFIFLGAPGVLLYVCARETHRYFCPHSTKNTVHTRKLMHILDWAPVRLTALGYLVVGDFTRAFPVWVDMLTRTRIPAYQLLWRVGRQAELIEPDDCKTCSKMTACVHVLSGVKLAKRNILFLLVLTALLTITGWIL